MKRWKLELFNIIYIYVCIREVNTEKRVSWYLARPRIFYTLSKIHKSMDLLFVSNKLLPERPIVSDCLSDSYHILEFIDHFIQPLSNRHPSYFKDTRGLLDQLRYIDVPSDAILITADVKSLYTNIQPD